MNKKNRKTKKQAKQIGFDRKQLIPWAVFLFTFIIYANTMNNHYAVDDNIVIKGNRFVVQGYRHLGELLTKPIHYGTAGVKGDNRLYRPLTMLSFATDIQFFGREPFAFHHFMNTFLFSLSMLLLYLLLLRLFKKQGFVLPLIISLLYAAHPIHTEVVANIKSRDEILSFLFGLVIVLFMLFKYLDTGQRRYLAASIISYLIGIFSKENAITFLALIPLTLYFFSDLSNKKIIAMSAPFLLAACLFFGVRHVCLSSVMAEAERAKSSQLNVSQQIDNLLDEDIERIRPRLKLLREYKQEFLSVNYAAFNYNLIKYIKLLIYPHPLVWDYAVESNKTKTFTSIWVIISAIINLSLLIFAIIRFRKKSVFSYCIIFYLTTSSIYFYNMVNTVAPIAERNLFTPSLAFSIASGILLVSLFSDEQTQKMRKRLVIPLTVILALYSFQTISRNVEWKDTITVSMAATKYFPGSIRVQGTLATQYILSAEKERNPVTRRALWIKAKDRLIKMAKIDPDKSEIWYVLGLCYFHLAEFDNSEKAYRESLFLNTADYEIYNNLGGIYFYKEEYEKAIVYFKKYVKHNENDKEAVNNLGVVYLDYLKDAENALRYFLRAIEIDSAYSEPHERLGDIFTTKGAHRKAEAYYQKAYDLNPAKEYLLERIGTE